jgi:hypothetical protein
MQGRTVRWYLVVHDLFVCHIFTSSVHIVFTIIFLTHVAETKASRASMKAVVVVMVMRE